jgi:hypothetical protein
VIRDVLAVSYPPVAPQIGRPVYLDCSSCNGEGYGPIDGGPRDARCEECAGSGIQRCESCDEPARIRHRDVACCNAHVVCDGCEGAVSDAGPLKPYVVTSHEGEKAHVLYCDDCRDLAKCDWNGETAAIQEAA